MLRMVEDTETNCINMKVFIETVIFDLCQDKQFIYKEK